MGKIKKLAVMLFGIIIPSIVGGYFTALSSASAGDLGDLEVHFRTFYFNRDRSGPDREAFTQGLMLRYHTPYVADLFNVNASLFTNLKLVGEDGSGGTGLLVDEGDGSQSSYAKMGEVYANINLPYESILSVGRLQLNTPLLNDSDSRGTPSSTDAAVFNFSHWDTNFYAVASTGGSARDEESFSRYTDVNGDNFQVYVIGADKYFDNDAHLRGALGYAENVMKQAYIEAQFPWKFRNGTEVLLSGFQYFGSADGDGTYSEAGDGYDSSLTNLAARYTVGDAKILASYQKVFGDQYRISWDQNNSDSTDFGTWNSVTRLNFNRADEASWQFRVDYDLNNYLEGLSFMARYTTGDNISSSDGSEGKEWERDIELSYWPPAIPNLSFRWRNAFVKSTEAVNSNENRFIINYKIIY
jgi:imipenem/basic amino acid-specific outer membrane pore